MTESRGDCIRVVHPLFHGEGGGSSPTSPLQFTVEPIDYHHAALLNRAWHSRLPTHGVGYQGRYPSYVASFNGIAYAVAIWGNPVARNLPLDWLELRRLAHSPEVPPNTGSWMLGVMARLIRRDRPEITRLISYSDTEVHVGTIYKAAGWQQTNTSDGGEWTRPSRKRPANQSAAPKIRWERAL